MRANPLFRFGLSFALSFAVLAGGWVWLAPYYDRAILAGANAVFRQDDPPVAELGFSDRAITAFQLQGAERSPAFQFDPYGLFFNLVFLLAFLAATPGLGWSGRLRRMGLALVLLGLAHGAFVVVQVKAEFVNAGLTYMTPRAAYLYNWAAVLLGTLGEKLFPLLIAASLSWRAWWRALELGRLRVRGSAPCPCGSGRKYKRCCGRPASPRAAGRSHVAR